MLKIVIPLVLVLLILSSCQKELNNKKTNQNNSSSVSESVDNEPPIPKVTMDGEELPVVLSSYNWKDEVNFNVNYDELIENSDTVEINSDSEISIVYLVNNTKPEHLSYGLVWKEDGNWITYSNYPSEVKNKTIKINGIEEYIESIILYLNATWDSGKEAKYIIPIMNK